MSKVSNSSAATAYENNPIYVATEGIELLFKKALPVGIFIAAMIGLTSITAIPRIFASSSAGSSTEQATAQTSSSTTMQTEKEEQDVQKFVDGLNSVPSETWLILALLVLCFVSVVLFIALFFQGVGDYTSAQIAAGKEVTISDAVRGSLSQFWGYAWVMLLVGLKILLWSLLFVIPGIIMAVRYSLAGTAYFSGKRGNTAIKHSVNLTQGAWLTTNASQILLPVMTFGLGSLFYPGTKAVLFRQLGNYTAKGQEKPAAHALSWLVVLLPLTILFLFLVLVSIIAAAIAKEFS